MYSYDKTREVLDKIRLARTREEISTRLLLATSEWGLDSVLAGAPPERQSDSYSLEQDLLLMSWPSAWIERYFQRNYVAVDPVIRTAATSLNSSLWSDVYSASDKHSAGWLIANEASDVGLRNGIVVPMVSVEGRHLGISIGGNCKEIPDFARGVATLFATFALAHSVLLGPAQLSTQRRLTMRERDCLSWAAEGKTDWEISKILSIAEGTVDIHLSRARGKLNASNRAQAVALAIRSGDID